MGELLKNVRMLGGVVALVGGLVAAGIYLPSAEVVTAMQVVGGVGGAAALAALVAAGVKRFGGPKPPAPGATS